MKTIISSRPQRIYQAITLMLVVGILVLGVVGLVRTIYSSRQLPKPFDFAIYYLAASLLNNGNNDLYNVAAIHQMATQRGVDNYATQYPYPPVFAALIRPLALLPFDTSSIIWFFLNLLWILAAAFFLWKISGKLSQKLPAGVIALAFILLPSLHLALQLGQVSPMLLGLCSLSLYLALRNRGSDKIGSGIAMGVATMVKVFPGILVVYALLSKKFRMGIASLTTIGILIFLGIWLGGGWLNSVNYVSVFLINFYLTRLESIAPSVQSLAAFFNHLFTPIAVHIEILKSGNRYGTMLQPLINYPSLATTSNYLATLLIVATSAVAIYQIRQRSSNPQLWATGFGMVILVPLLIISTAYYHYSVLALLPMIVVLQISRQQKRPIVFNLCLLSYLCLIIQRYSNWLIVLSQSFWLAFFGLYGILLLWGISIYIIFTWKESPEHC